MVLLEKWPIITLAAVVVVGKYSGASTRSRQRGRFHPTPSPQLPSLAPTVPVQKYTKLGSLVAFPRPAVAWYKAPWVLGSGRMASAGALTRVRPVPPPLSAPSTVLASKVVSPTQLATKPRDGLDRPG